MSDTDLWHYRDGGGNEHGPFGTDEMVRLVASGQLNPETMAWSDRDGTPIAIKETRFTGPVRPTAPLWHYERAGKRIGPLQEGEILRAYNSGEISRETLVWSPGVGPSFVRLGDTQLIPPSNEPPPLPATAVDNSLVWVLVAIPLCSAFIERIVDAPSFFSSGWTWTCIIVAANWTISLVDEKRVKRSGVATRDISFGFWFWLIPVYLYQRARALRGGKNYVWAWWVSFAASLAITLGPGDLRALLSGEMYLGSGLPPCDSSFEIRQVKKVFDSVPAVRAAGINALTVSRARQLSAPGDELTCLAQVDASNGQTYSVSYTVEKRGDDQFYTRLQID
jgi:hypothetical protein